MTETPVLQSADTDGNGFRRRRRPALSCVECRTRKVRCDREKPCGACTRIHSTTCTYRSERAAIRRSHDTSSESALSSTGRQNLQARNTTIRLRNQTQYLASSERSGLASTDTSPQLSQDLGGQRDGTSDLTITTLLERISNLEKRLSVNNAVDEPGINADFDRAWPTVTTGSFAKSKFFGQSHWANAMEPYDALGDSNTVVNQSTNRREVNQSTELYTTLAELKRIARVIKASRMLRPLMQNVLHELVPEKEVCDELLDGYFRTFEGPYRILHVPSFWKDYNGYWTDPTAAKPSSILRILLTCAIGVPFYTGERQPKLRIASAKWVQAANEWLSAPHMKSRLNMTGLQIQILTILARQVGSIDSDHVWVSVGALLKTAMLLGLHRDPSHFEKISTFHSEMRRRLWATVLELNVQTSLDMGMPPMISVDDYDTAPPSNIDDEQIADGDQTSLQAKPQNTFTDCSMQRDFLRTLPARLDIVRRLNSLRFTLSYTDVLNHGAKLTQACREIMISQKTALASRKNITAFKIKFVDCMTRRFILCLHRPYFAKANQDPRFHYSRKFSLDTALAMYTPVMKSPLSKEDDWSRLNTHSVNGFKHVFLFAISTAYYELNALITERQNDLPLLTPLVSNPTQPAAYQLALPVHFDTLRAILHSSLLTATAWIRNGGTNAKGVVFLDCALARIDALVAGVDPEKAVLQAAKRSVEDCRMLMAAAYRDEQGEDINLDVSVDPFQGREHGRGEGADDVTGRRLRTGTAVWPACAMNSEGIGKGEELETGMEGMEMDVELDFDFNAYMQGQSMDVIDGYHFGRSPEWFFDLGGLFGGPAS